jgi:FMN-dependent NADH-azoreductase
MSENNIKNDFLFKRMRSMISEKRTNDDDFIQYDIEQQKVIHIDFQHIEFNRERSKTRRKEVEFKVFEEINEIIEEHIKL